MLAILVYLAARLFGGGTLEQTLVQAAGLVSTERADSLQFRYLNEAALLDRFWLQPWFGSSPWGFNAFVFGETGFKRGHAIPDSLWIQAVSVNGLLGIVGVVFNLWAPVARGLGLMSDWRRRVAPEVVICALMVMLYLIDSLVNGFKTPIYVLMAGGLSRVSLFGATAPASAAPRRQPLAQTLQPRGANDVASRGSVVKPRARPTNLRSSWLR